MRTVAATILVIGVLSNGFGMAPVTATAADPSASDWPQWRGPNRDGIAGPGPKLADAWPEGGPKLLWKSAPIPCGFTGVRQNDANGGQEGGLGSVTVADAKAFVYVHWRHRVGTIAITAELLNEFGWMKGVPDDLGRKVDAEIMKLGTAPKKDRDAFIKEFLATLDPKLAEKYGPWVEKRITLIWKSGKEIVKPNSTAKSWADLAKLAAIIDKPFPTYKDLMDEFQRIDVAKGDPDGFFYYLDKQRNDLNTSNYKYVDTVICLNASTGKELWKKEFPGSGKDYTAGILASGTPAVWDGKCYASGSAGLYCLSVKDGSVVWQAKTKFTHSSPLVANGGVFLMLKELTAFDALTGKMLWTQPKIRAGECCGSVVQWTSGGKSFLIAENEGPSCIDPANGEVLWHVATRGGDGTGRATPVICGDAVLDITGNHVSAIELTEGKRELLWSKSPGCSNAGGSSVVYRGYVYQTPARYSGICMCRDLKTGELKWQALIGCQCTSTIAADGKIFIAHNFGYGRTRLVMFKATPEKFELLGLGAATDPVPQGCTPSIANGKLFVRLKDCVACYDITAAGNPLVTPPKSAVVMEGTYTLYRSIKSGDTWNVVSAVDKGDSLKLTDKDEKVKTVKKADIDDVVKPGMTWRMPSK